jgi:Tol biopolymer transport system component
VAALVVGLPLAGLSIGLPTSRAAAASSATERVSVSSSAAESNAGSGDSSISADGRWVAFSSDATNLVPSDTNGVSDVFVHDRVMGTTVRVSVDSSGTQANGASSKPSISGDGRVVAFLSSASNLVAGDTNGASDVFIHDLVSGATTRVSVDSAGNESHPPLGFIFSFAGPSISEDGKFVAFDSGAPDLVVGDTNGAADAFVRDLVAGTTTRVSVDSSGAQGNNSSIAPFISSDGRYVAFSSFADNLVAGDTNARGDVFLRDRLLSTTIRVSIDSSGIQSATGVQSAADVYTPSVSSDGRYIAFDDTDGTLVAGDNNGVLDVFVRDVTGGTTTRVSVDSSGNQATGPGSPPSNSVAPSMTPDGRYVTFLSWATNLVSLDSNGMADVFVHDRQTSLTTRASVGLVQSNGEAEGDPSISANGQFIAFASTGSNLVTGDTNGAADVFVRDTVAGTLPSAPVLAVSAALGAVDVSWTAPAAGGSTITEYQLYRATASGAETLLTSLGAVTSYEDHGVALDGSTYFYTVAAVTAVGQGPDSNEGSAIPTPDPSGEFTPLTPSRILDTRNGTDGHLGKLGPGATLDVQIDGRGGVPLSGVAAVVLNATVTEPTAPSYLTVWPSGVSRPSSSNLNYLAGQTVPNLVTVAVGNGKVSVYNNAGATHVIFDVVGYYSDSTGNPGSRFHALTPFRDFDTRVGSGGVGKQPIGSGQSLHFKVTGRGGVPSSGVTSVVMNVTVTQPTSSGFLTVYPDDVARPVASNLNFVRGRTVPNLVVVRVPASGVVDFYNLSNSGGTVHLVADVVGYYDGIKSTQAGRLVTGVPERLIDTRVSSPAPPPGCIPGGATLAITFTSPEIMAVVLNITVTQPTTSGYVTAYPLPPPPPLASTVNYVSGQTVPNLAVVKLGSGGSIGFYNNAGCTHLVIDAFAAFTSTAAPAPNVTPAHATDATGIGAQSATVTRLAIRAAPR